MDRNRLALVVAALVVWLITVVILYASAGCSTATPC